MIQVRKISRGILAIAAAFFFISAAGRADADTFPKFSSVSLEGKSVASSIFAENKITMVNVWATWCGPCVSEMPGLGKLARSMPEGSRLVGVVLDVDNANDSGAINKAKSIMNKANADFLQIILCDDMAPLMETVSAIPTTFFVDSKGDIVGDPVVGSMDEEDYREAVSEALKSAR